MTSHPHTVEQVQVLQRRVEICDVCNSKYSFRRTKTISVNGEKFSYAKCCVCGAKAKIFYT